VNAVALQFGTEEPAGAPHAPVALARLLDDLASLILHVPPSVYGAQLLPGVTGSVGEHVRHILDHVAAFISSFDQTVLTYDHRERGTAVETDSGMALGAVLRLAAVLDAMDDEQLDRPIAVSVLLERGSRPMLMHSTRRRELAFVISHTVHHQALIAVLLTLAGEDAPATFGVAPSTPLPA
jgi:uncharacterized damage-inducible protein DinB